MKSFLFSRREAPPKKNLAPWSRPEARIVAGYLILASVWIIGSDATLTTSNFSQNQVGLIQTLKGLNFVATTAFLLFIVLHRAYDGWRVAELRRRIVIENARERFRRLCIHVQDLREEDRIRIAREIHDQLGQLLTGIKMDVRMLEDRLANRDDRSLNPAIDKLVEISEMVDQTINSVQLIASGLRPSALDNLDLGTALIEEAEQFTRRSGVHCTIEVGEFRDRLAPAVTTAAFRIFQEALTNTSRHADALRIDAKLEVHDKVLKLAIHDDGKGIDPAAVDDPKSLGLMGMLERAESVGGSVAFTPHPQRGTDVILTVPIVNN